MCFPVNLRTLLASLFWVIAVLVVPELGAAEAKNGGAYSIRAVRAYFFFQESGRFGSLDLLDPSRVLWNTPIGGGDEGEPSEATLVLVELSGPAFDRNPTGKLELIARTSTRELNRQSTQLSQLFARAQKLMVPFLVLGSGCEPVRLEVRLSGVVASEQTVVREIPFQCGE